MELFTSVLKTKKLLKKKTQKRLIVSLLEWKPRIRKHSHYSMTTKKVNQLIRKPTFLKVNGNPSNRIEKLPSKVMELQLSMLAKQIQKKPSPLKVFPS